MRAVIAQKGKIVFPNPDENYLKWLKGKGKGRPPRQGSVPNRFKAQVKANFNSKHAEQVVESVQKAWYELAELVWRQDLEAHVGKVQRDIWERQIKSFWEISWALTDDEKASDLLDRRKNWRNHFAPTEPGVKCLVMEGWQELSGIQSPNKLDTFWQPIRNQLKRDLAADEHLCAIAFVKRRFARHFNEKFSVTMPGGWKLKGWKLETGVPSVSYLAVLHWLEQVILNEDDDKLHELHEAARELGTEYGEWQTDICCIDNAYQQPKKTRRIKRLTALDGRVFFEQALLNDSLDPAKQAAAQKMLTALNALDINTQPTPFYAILLMDGDSLGKHMSDIEKQPKISAALEKFTNNVPQVVYQHNGFLVYAGGDDVLAILPLEDAFCCATALREVYLNAFEGSGVRSTLSGAIEFAHIKMPLTRILRDAHSLLDNVAKDGCGRDAIAVRVWKQGGNAIEWAMPWEIALDNNQIILDKLKQQFLDKDNNEAAFSNKFFYKIRERFELLNPAEPEQQIITEDDAKTLLAADYLASGVNDTRRKEEQLTLPLAEAKISQLLKQCRQVIRDPDNPDMPDKWQVVPELKVDGALLVRFLANKGIERR